MDFARHATEKLTVSFGSSLDVKEQVRQAIDIVDLVGSYLQLRRQGRGYVALCPWHDDTRPSLQVNPERQSFKCWVCDIGGDVFSFFMKMEGVEFREALAHAGGAGGHRAAEGRPTHRDRRIRRQRRRAFDKQTLYKAAAWADRNTTMPAGIARGRSPPGAISRSAGSPPRASSGSTWVLAAGPGLDPQQAGGDAGRAGPGGHRHPRPPGGGGSLYDRFRGRLLFSIRDVQGRPVGLGGRVLPEIGFDQPRQVLNSPETPLFTKSHLLYGLDLARDDVPQEPARRWSWKATPT